MSNVGRPVGASQSDFSHTGGAGLERWEIANCANSAALGTGAPTANVLRAMPFISPRRGGTLDRIGYNITTSVAGNTRIGLYTNTSDTTKYPASLVVDSGSQVNATAPFKITISQTLSPGRIYWLAIVSDVASTIRAISLTGCGSIMGCDNTMGTALSVGLSVAYAFAALPSTFTAGAADITATPIPALYYRFSA